MTSTLPFLKEKKISRFLPKMQRKSECNRVSPLLLLADVICEQAVSNGWEKIFKGIEKSRVTKRWCKMKLKLDFKVRMLKVDLLSKSQWKWKLNIFMCKWKLSIFVCKIFKELRKTYVMAYNFTHQKFMVGTSHNFKRQNSN